MFLTACLLAAVGGPPDEPKTTTLTQTRSWGYGWNWRSGDPMPAMPPLALPVLPTLPGVEMFRTPPGFPADLWLPGEVRRFRTEQTENLQKAMPVMPGFPAEKLFPKLPGFEPIPNLPLPTGPGAKSGFVVRSAATDIRRDGDRFTARLTDRDGILEVTGRVTGGVAVPDEVTVRGPDKKATTYKLSDTPGGRREALRVLLEQVR